ncbi:MAG: DNA repair protein RecN [Pseudomonadota bacterium]
MLRSLAVRDILLIDALELEFAPGLNVLTGETGAGKSILLDSLGFALGWRRRGEMLRAGAEDGEVVAVFEIGAEHAARALLAEAEIAVDEDEIILRRVLDAGGRSRTYLNDRRASGDLVRAVAETLVEVHGQHDDRGLLNPRGHRLLLDTFAGNAAALGVVRQAWAERQRAEAALAAARAAAEEAARDADWLTHAVDELTEFAPEPGEDAALDTRRRQMQAAVKIREDVERAAAALGGEGAGGRLGDALRWLEGAADRAEGALDGPIQAVADAFAALDEAERGVEGALETLTHDPLELERVEERLFALRALARKHNVAPDDLATLTEGLVARRAALEGGAEQIAALETALAEAEAAYDRAAADLGKKRRAAATRLDAAMAEELPPLKLERARFHTAIEAASPGPEGCDSVAFTVATNPGAPAGPIDRIASGGELSRFLLALKVCLTTRAGDLTLIFDEIDRGVGGATADAVGRRLAAIAADAQVLVVTHSPQVAAAGAAHWRIAKSAAAENTRTDVARLSEDARVDEIARMLAGAEITEAAREAAKALLES